MALTDFQSSVYIADSDGTDKIYMDIDPVEPYFNVSIDRDQKAISFGCSMIEDATITAILLNYSTFKDVKVGNGTVEYLCRWADNGFVYTQEAKTSKSARFNFIIIEPASTKVYIADSGGGNKVYMDIEPYPFPIVTRDKSGKYLSWESKYITSAHATSLISKFPNDVEVSLDNGSTKYTCRWTNNTDSLQIIQTAEGNLSLKVSFEIIATVGVSTPSLVYIADSGGGNKVYMDIDPYPFPEIKRDRKKKYLSWDCSYITRTHANSLITKYPNDVEVSLDNGSTKYLCRWTDGTEALDISASTKDVLSLKVSFEILAVVSASPSGKIKIYDHDATNAVTLDSDPDPFPVINKARSGSSEKTCPYLSGSVLTSGENIHFDGGVHISDGTIEFEVPYISSTTLASLQTKYDKMEDVVVSLNSGTTKYTCIWAEGVSLQATTTGSASYSLQCRFKIVSLYT